MKELIIQSPKYGKFISFIDDDDFKRVSKYKWHINLHRCTGTFYVSRNVSKNKAIRHLNPYYSLSRFILQAPPGVEVDHIDLNKINNQKNNLRLSTHIQNNTNKTAQVNSTTGYKGVHFFKSRQNYQCYIEVNKKRKFLGYFNTAIEGAIAYNQAALQYHGEFARLNPIP